MLLPPPLVPASAAAAPLITHDAPRLARRAPKTTVAFDEDESPLMRAMQRAAQALEQPEPGTPIVQVDCPCCGAELDIQHGDEPGQVGVVGEAAP